MVYSDGSRYEGDWLNDAQNRQGTFFFSKGDKFTGTWRDGVREGKGVYIYKDGEKKEGYWKNDEFVTELAMEDSKSQITPAEGIIKLSEKKLLQLSVKNAPVYLVFTYDKSLQLNMEIATQKGELLYSVDLSAGNSVKIGENGNYQITLIDRIGAGRWKVLLMNETEFNR